MKRTTQNGRRHVGRAVRWAVSPAAAAMLASCVAVAIPVPIVTGPTVSDSSFRTLDSLDGTQTRTARYDSTRVTAEEAEAFIRQDCADEGLSLDTLPNALPPRGAPRAAASGRRSTITYTCRQ